MAFYTNIAIHIKIIMAVIRVRNKKAIDDLQARLMLRTGRQISKQEVLDICVEFANVHFEEMIRTASLIPILTPEIADEIIKTFEKFKDTLYNPNAKSGSDIDNDVYSP